MTEGSGLSSVDTLRLVRRLEAQGLETGQAEHIAAYLRAAGTVLTSDLARAARIEELAQVLSNDIATGTARLEQVLGDRVSDLASAMAALPPAPPPALPTPLRVFALLHSIRRLLVLALVLLLAIAMLLLASLLHPS